MMTAKSIMIREGYYLTKEEIAALEPFLLHPSCPAEIILNPEFIRSCVKSKNDKDRRKLIRSHLTDDQVNLIRRASSALRNTDSGCDWKLGEELEREFGCDWC
jgi:hypothetical protein